MKIGAGSIEEARRHTDSMKGKGANACLAGKERILKYKILYHRRVFVSLFVCPLHLYI